MANEDSLLSVIDVLLKVLISFNLLKLLSALATVTGQVSKIRSAMYTFTGAMVQWLERPHCSR